MTKSNKLVKSVALIIILIFVFTLFLVYFSSDISTSRYQKTLDPIYTVATYENGAENVSIDVTLDFTTSTKYSQKELQLATESALQDLDYDELKSVNAINYLQEKIYIGLKDIYPDIDSNINILITDIKMGYMAELYEEQNSNSGNEDIYKGLFKNIN